jgi:hypothetical protein
MGRILELMSWGLTSWLMVTLNSAFCQPHCFQ